MGKSKKAGKNITAQLLAPDSETPSPSPSFPMAASFRPQESCGLPKAIGWKRQPGCWPESSFFPGTILRTMVCETHTDQDNNHHEHGNRFKAPMPPFDHEHFFCNKNRLFIVVKNFYDHYLALPLWSFNRQGLRHKDPKLELECIRIRDHRRSEGDYENLGPEVRDLVTEEMFEPVMLFPESTVYVTRPEALLYILPFVSRLGYLSDESTTLLIKMYNNLCTVDQQEVPPFFNRFWPTERPEDSPPAEGSTKSSTGPGSRVTGGKQGQSHHFLR